MTLPFDNNTRLAIRRLTSAQLKHDKLKKSLTISAIALAAFLMTAVLLLIAGIITVNQNGGNSVTGSYHALISGITQEQYDNLSADPRIELSGLNVPAIWKPRPPGRREPYMQPLFLMIILKK